MTTESLIWLSGAIAIFAWIGVGVLAIVINRITKVDPPKASVFVDITLWICFGLCFFLGSVFAVTHSLLTRGYGLGEIFFVLILRDDLPYTFRLRYGLFISYLAALGSFVGAYLMFRHHRENSFED
jgi:hypothetical protein